MNDAWPRLEAGDKVTGVARFEGDLPEPGMLHAALVTSPIARGQVLGFDLEETRASPGFVAALTHETAPRLKPARFRLPLQDDRVRFAGQPVAIVLAATPHQARAAAAALKVQYRAETPETDLVAGAAEAFQPPPFGDGGPCDSRRGDPEAALAKAAVAIEGRYTMPAHIHHPLEPHVAIARWDGGKLLVRTATQAVFATQRVLSRLFDTPATDVTVISRLLGGGFGAKGPAWFPELVLTVMAARAAGRPVRLELTRAQMFTLVGRRPQSLQTVALGAARDGRLAAIVHDSLGDTSTYGEYADPNATVSRWLYDCPNVATRHRIVRRDLPQSNPMRAPGAGSGSFALECALDELAHELGMDPMELRLRNYAAHDPHLERPWTSKRLDACYRIGAEAFGWERRPRRSPSRTHGRWTYGAGMATAAYPVHRMGSQARVRFEPDGRLVVACGTQDMGTGTLTVIGELAARILGAPRDAVEVEIGSTELPPGPYSGGSIATASFAPAVEQAAVALRRKVLELAVSADGGPLAGLAPDALVLEAGLLRQRGGRSERLTALLARAAPSGLQAEAEAPAGDDVGGTAMGHGAVFAEVAVDLVSGEVRMNRITAAYAAGRILNPRLARSQYVGGLVCGIGMALHEEVTVDPVFGRIPGETLCDYLVPTHADMPAFDIHLVPEDDPHLPSGVKGIGMLGAVGVAAAIANAVFDATGRRIRDLPLRLERVAP